MLFDSRLQDCCQRPCARSLERNVFQPFSDCTINTAHIHVCRGVRHELKPTIVNVRISSFIQSINHRKVSKHMVLRFRKSDFFVWVRLPWPLSAVLCSGQPGFDFAQTLRFSGFHVWPPPGPHLKRFWLKIVLSFGCGAHVFSWHRFISSGLGFGYPWPQKSPLL